MSIRRKRKKRPYMLIFVLFLVAAAVVLPKLNGLNATPLVLETEPSKKPTIKTNPTQSDDELLIKADIDFIEAGVELMLVNRDYPMYNDNEIITVSAYKEVPLFRADIMLNEKMLEAVKQFFAAAKNSGFYDFFVNSGYRTEDEQQKLYNEADDKAFVNHPGESEHQTGLAADIAVKGMSGEKMGGSKEGRWLAENAWKYGLILRYPEDKTEITGIAYEPWHFRYIGIPHAYFCYTKDLCFEEYINYLKVYGGYKVTIDEAEYHIFYQEPENGIIKLPDKDHDISIDNTGGYIITIGG